MTLPARVALRAQIVALRSSHQRSATHIIRPSGLLAGPRSVSSASRLPRPSLLPHSVAAPPSARAAWASPLGLRALHVWSIDVKKSTPVTQRDGRDISLLPLQGRTFSEEERAAALAHNDAMCFLHGLDGYPVDAVRACEHLQKAADGGYAPAMVLLAHHYLMGIGVPFDALEGVRLLRVAAEGGCLDAQVELARVLIVASRARDEPFLARRCEHLTGNPMYGAMKAAKDIGGDAREGVRLLEEAAAAGNDVAIACLGIFRLRMADEHELPPPDVLQPDDALGVSLLRQAVEAGNTAAVHILASALLADAKTEAEGEELLRQCSAKGDRKAQALLASRLLNSEDPATAAEGRAMAREAAEGGDLEAMFVYACALLHGMGGSADIAEGATWLLRAGEGGLAVAQTMLGLAHDGGDKDLGFVMDKEKSLYWHTLAAWGGSLKSQIALAAHYLGRRGGEMNQKEALFWVEKAAHLSGDPQTLYHVGAMYIRGIGTAKHPERGWGYMRLAAERGAHLAMMNIGFAAMTGLATPYVPADIEAGESILQHTADMGCLEAKALLAKCYIHANDPERKEEGERMLKEAVAANPDVFKLLGLVVDPSGKESLDSPRS